jgi:hypothetical protein
MASVYSENITNRSGINMTAWANIVNQLNNSEENPEPKRITLEQYEAWRKDAIFDGLRGIRFGQSFCNSFDITDNILFFTLNHVDADEYIRKLYIA